MFETAEAVVDGVDGVRPCPGAAARAEAVEDLDRVGLAAGLDALVVEQRRVGARRLALVVAWADRHHPDAEADPHPDRTRGRALTPGAEGTPALTRAGLAELGVLLRTTTGSARRLLADALDLRHRHPLLWAAVQDLQVEDWVARKVARLCSPLTPAQARRVDTETLPALLGLPLGRALAVVEAAVIRTDPTDYDALRETEASHRYVSTARPSNRYGLRTLIAQTTAADIARLEAMLEHQPTTQPTT
jgi:hypothetical protein